MKIINSIKPFNIFAKHSVLWVPKKCHLLCYVITLPSPHFVPDLTTVGSLTSYPRFVEPALYTKENFYKICCITKRRFKFLFHIFLIIGYISESKSLDLIQRFMQHELIKDSKGTLPQLKVMLSYTSMSPGNFIIRHSLFSSLFCYKERLAVRVQLSIYWCINGCLYWIA